MLISVFYMKVNKVIMAVLMISISHRCNSLGVLLWDSFPSVKITQCHANIGRLTNLSPNLHHVQKIMQMNWVLNWKTQHLGDINQRKNMQTKVTVIPILMHKWHSCDLTHCISIRFLAWTGAQMEIHYETTSSHYFFYFSSQRSSGNGLQKKKIFSSHLGAHALPLQ